MKMSRLLRGMVFVLCAMVLLSFGAVAADSLDKPVPGIGPGNGGNVTVLSNGIYKVSIFNDAASSTGIYTVGTGGNHPVADANMLYGGGEESPGTSYLSVCDYSGDVVYTSDATISSAEPTGYAIAYLGGCGVTFHATSTRATTVWSPSGALEVEQVVAVEGSTIADSRVRVTTKVTNRDSSIRQVGIRYLWDMMVADEDGAWFATRDPDSSFTHEERIYTPPQFDRYVEADRSSHPSLMFFGSVSGPQGIFSPTPTAPGRFINAAWGAASSNAWEYPSGQDPSSDNAVLYYWGWDDKHSPISLSPGKSVSVTAYLYGIPPDYDEPGVKKARPLYEPSEDRPLEPAHMMANYLSIDPQQVLPGQEVRISANVCNSGEEKGSLTASLEVNGDAEQSQSIAVSGGSCKAVVFVVSRAVPGTYQVSVGGMQGQFTVLAPLVVQGTTASVQDIGLGTWGIVAILAVALVLIVGLVVVFRT